MSAFICSDVHIFTIASKVADHFSIDKKELADKLKAINIESVNYRYNEETPKRKCKALICKADLTSSDIVKLVSSYLYQSCEKPSLDYVVYSGLLNTFKTHLITYYQACDSEGKYWTI
jgi:hypothetical protein